MDRERLVDRTRPDSLDCRLRQQGGRARRRARHDR